MSTIIYPDALLFPALMREVREAQSSIQIMTFLFRTGYAQPTRADELLDAVIEAQQQRGVEVFAVMNNSRTAFPLPQGKGASVPSSAAFADEELHRAFRSRIMML